MSADLWADMLVEKKVEQKEYPLVAMMVGLMDDQSVDQRDVMMAAQKADQLVGPLGAMSVSLSVAVLVDLLADRWGVMKVGE